MNDMMLREATPENKNIGRIKNQTELMLSYILKDIFCNDETSNKSTLELLLRLSNLTYSDECRRWPSQYKEFIEAQGDNKDEGETKWGDMYSMARGHRQIGNNVKSETESELRNLTQQGRQKIKMSVLPSGYSSIL